jgi:hypothetical protein
MICVGSLLIGVVPSRADIKVIGFGSIASVEKTKIAVPHNLEASVQKAALNDQGLFAFNDCLIESREDFSSQIVIAKSGGWKSDLTRREFSLFSSIFQC